MNNRLKTRDYIIENYSDQIKDWKLEGLGNTDVARELMEIDQRLSMMNLRNLRRIVERAYTKLSRSPRIMVYDIETTRGLAEVWSTGKTYIGHNQLRTETKIVTIAYKWLGADEIYYLEWTADNSPEGGDDNELMIQFLKFYNDSDLVIGWNNNNFDNKLINTRALKHRLQVNTMVKSYDLMVQAKRVFRQPSNSLAYYARFLGLGGKLNHSGLKMWQDIQWGVEEDSREAMDMMIKYNLQDVALTEEVYLILRSYLGSVIHTGVFNGKGKISCPNCGKNKGKLTKTTCTTAGTIQRQMRCSSCDTQYKVSNTTYLNNIK